MDCSKIPITKCPYCDSDEGFYVKMQARGTIIYRHNFDGSEAENGCMYDSLRYSGGNVAYCICCGKKLFNMSVLE